MSAVTQNTFSYAAIVQPYMPVFYVSFLVTIVLTPIMRALAHRHGVVDDPDNKRKVHTQPIAYLGGVSIFLGWIAGVTVSVFLRSHYDVGGAGTVQIPPGILMGAMAVVLFGLMDDVYSLSPKVKLLGQFLAAALMIVPGMLPIPGFAGTDFLIGQGNGSAWMILNSLSYFGMIPNMAHPPGYVLALAPVFSACVAVFVIVSTCNATNLLDGLDGLCSGVTGVMSAGYLLLSVYLAHTALASAVPVDPVRICLSLALLGAVLGFLPFNFNPASIFMGDTGSMFLGFMCGTMILLFGQNGVVKWFLSAIIMFGLPMMDTLLAIVRRKLNGKKIFAPDSNHFHHFLIRRGFTVRRAVLLSYAVAAVFVSFGLVIVIIPTRMALGVYMVLFGWIIVAAFKMGMIFQEAPAMTANTTLNLSVITPAVTKPVWPSEGLAAELRALNRERLRDHANPILRGREAWPNQQACVFAEELSQAQSLGVSPCAYEQPEFTQLLSSGQRFNWAILLDGSLRISSSIISTEDGPVRISHAVLCYNGGDVLAAGEGRAGDYLSNTSGHYQNEDFVIPPVKRAFAQIGVVFRK